jgi:hypothetical protein
MNTEIQTARRSRKPTYGNYVQIRLSVEVSYTNVKKLIFVSFPFAWNVFRRCHISHKSVPNARAIGGRSNGNYLEGSCRNLTEVLYRHFLDGLRKLTEKHSQDNWCPETGFEPEIIK